MKTKKKWYNFSKKELEIVREIAIGSRNLAELKSKLNIRPNLLTYHLKKLKEKEIIEAKKCYYSPLKNSEPRKTISIHAGEHAFLLKELFQKFPSIEWENALSESGIEMLLQITDQDKAETIAHTTVWRYSKRLEKLGVMTCIDGLYQIKDNFSGLPEFVEAYRAYIMRKLLNSVSTAETKILWHKGPEFLIRVPKGKGIAQEGFQKAGTSLLPSFRIASVTDFDVYLYSKSKHQISVEETILHILLIDRGNARYTTYSFLLLKKELNNIDESSLVKKAEGYNLCDKINHLMRIVKGP